MDAHFVDKPISYDGRQQVVSGPTGLLICRKSTLNVHISNDLAQAGGRDQDMLGLLLQPGARSKPGASFEQRSAQ